MTTAPMKKALLSLLAASAVAVATPALAQSYGYGYGYSGGLDARQADLAERVDRAAYYGRISRREAQDLRAQLDACERLEWSYRRNGLSRWERDDLQRRLDRVEYELRHDRRDGNRHDRW